MPNKSFIKRLVERRIPHILGSYLVAGTSLILFIEYLVEKYQFPSHYPTLALFALIGILPYLGLFPKRRIIGNTSIILTSQTPVGSTSP